MLIYQKRFYFCHKINNLNPPKMKKLSILFVSVLTLGLALTSCNSDDDKDNGSIEGKWQISEAGVVLNGQEVLQPYVNDGGCPNEITEFKADGKFVDTYSESTDGKCTSYTEDGTWTKDGNKLNKKFGSETETSEITELTGSKLKLKQTYSEGGMTVSAVVVYKKI